MLTSSRRARQAGGSASVSEQLRLRELGRRGVVAHPDLASRLSLVRRLREHSGCVHALSWSAGGAGELLVSGSDDLHINLWSMCGSALRSSHLSGHSNTIFSAVLAPQNDAQAVSCAADGEVRLHDLAHGGSGVFASFEGTMVFKLAFRPGCASTFLSTNDDGTVRLFDLRAPSAGAVLADLGQRTATTNLAFRPGGTDVFAVGADPDPFVRTFDLRSCAQPLRSYAPAQLCHAPRGQTYRQGGASGVDWAPGNLLAASYRNGDIYLFDTRESEPTPLATTTATSARPSCRPAEACVAPAMRYSGARNCRGLLKQVRFLFGGEYLAAGSDCGRLFVWRTRTGRLAHLLKADGAGADCLAPHAHLPLLAVSGSDHDIKLFEACADPAARPGVLGEQGWGERALESYGASEDADEADHERGGRGGRRSGGHGEGEAEATVDAQFVGGGAAAQAGELAGADNCTTDNCSVEGRLDAGARDREDDDEDDEDDNDDDGDACAATPGLGEEGTDVGDAGDVGVDVGMDVGDAGGDGGMIGRLHGCDIGETTDVRAGLARRRLSSLRGFDAASVQREGGGDVDAAQVNDGGTDARQCGGGSPLALMDVADNVTDNAGSAAVDAADGPEHADGAGGAGCADFAMADAPSAAPWQAAGRGAADTVGEAAAANTDDGEGSTRGCASTARGAGAAGGRDAPPGHEALHADGAPARAAVRGEAAADAELSAPLHGWAAPLPVRLPSAPSCAVSADGSLPAPQVRIGGAGAAACGAGARGGVASSALRVARPMTGCAVLAGADGRPSASRPAAGQSVSRAQRQAGGAQPQPSGGPMHAGEFRVPVAAGAACGRAERLQGGQQQWPRRQGQCGQQQAQAQQAQQAQQQWAQHRPPAPPLAAHDSQWPRRPTTDTRAPPAAGGGGGSSCARERSDDERRCERERPSQRRRLHAPSSGAARPAGGGASLLVPAGSHAPPALAASAGAAAARTAQLAAALPPPPPPPAREGGAAARAGAQVPPLLRHQLTPHGAPPQPADPEPYKSRGSDGISPERVRRVASPSWATTPRNAHEGGNVRSLIASDHADLREAPRSDCASHETVDRECDSEVARGGATSADAPQLPCNMRQRAWRTTAGTPPPRHLTPQGARATWPLNDLADLPFSGGQNFSEPELDHSLSHLS